MCLLWNFVQYAVDEVYILLEVVIKAFLTLPKLLFIILLGCVLAPVGVYLFFKLPPSADLSSLGYLQYQYQARATGYLDNSLAGIKANIELGYRHLEVDVQFTKDLVPVLGHTNLNGVQISSILYRDLKKFRQITPLLQQQGLFLPLKAIFPLIKQYDVHIILNLKHTLSSRKAAKKLVKLIRKFKLEKQIILSASDTFLLFYTLQYAPELITSLRMVPLENTMRWVRQFHLYYSFEWLTDFLGVGLVIIPDELASETLIKKLLNQDVCVYVIFHHDSPKRQRLMQDLEVGVIYAPNDT